MEDKIAVCVISNALPPFYAGAERRAFKHVQRLRKNDKLGAILVGMHRLPKRQSETAFPNYVYDIRLWFPEGSKKGRIRNAIVTVFHIFEVSFRLGLCLFQLRKKYDVIHVFNPAVWFTLLPIPLAKILGKPIIVEMTLLGADDPMKLSRIGKHYIPQVIKHRPLKYSLFLQATAYISKSYGLSQAYYQSGLPKEKLIEIASGVDIDAYKPPLPLEKQELRRNLSLRDDQVILLFVGGINERKGVHKLLDGFCRIAAQHPKAHLLIIGPIERSDASYVQLIEKNILDWGLSNQVSFVPRMINNVVDYMKAADVFVLPSSNEGFSMAILEAMSCGLPIVATNIPEIAFSQVQHEKEGLLFSLNDIEELSNSLQKLIIDAGYRQSLGNMARQRVLSEFTHPIIDAKYIELYRKVFHSYYDKVW